jgi:hypothetical protein
LKLDMMLKKFEITGRIGRFPDKSASLDPRNAFD